MIEVKNLVKRYGDHYAVDHLSFTVEDGQIFGFLGPNGAGKSTTMNIMTGYLAATEGEVLMEGHDILEEPEAAQACIGYLPEIPPLYPDMTVEEYLPLLRGAEEDPRRSSGRSSWIRCLALTHLEDMSDRLIRNLSKGYRQRVGLAQAILGFPKIIILDEPTVGLDPKQVVEIRDLIRHLAKDHTVHSQLPHPLGDPGGVRPRADHPQGPVRGLRHPGGPGGEAVLRQLPGGDRQGRAGAGGGRAGARCPPSAAIRCWSRPPTRPALRSGRTAMPGRRCSTPSPEARCPLLELRPRMASLEEVFLDLTDDDDAVAAQAAALLAASACRAASRRKEGTGDESDL